MPTPTKQISLHRFHDYVAFCTEDTQTLYLTADTARRFAGKLLDFANDIKVLQFTSSTLRTQEVHIENNQT